MTMPSYPVSTIAKLLNLTERRVQQLASDGIIPKPDKGKYDLVASVRGYIKFLQDRAFGKDTSNLDSHAEKARLIKAQADKTELEVKAMERKLIPTEEVLQLWAGLVMAFRAKMLSLPLKAARQILVLEGDFKKIEEVLKDHVYEALTELAHYEAQQIGDSTDTSGGTAGDAAAEIDGEPVGGSAPEAE